MPNKQRGVANVVPMSKNGYGKSKQLRYAMRLLILMHRNGATDTAIRVMAKGISDGPTAYHSLFPSFPEL